MKRLLSIVFAVLVMLNCAIAVSGEESINDDNISLWKWEIRRQYYL